MKRNILFSVYIILLCANLFSALCINIVNAENNSQLTLTNKSYTVWKIDEEQIFTKISINISITLHNSGTNISDDITVTLWDVADNPPLPIRRNATILPGQSHLFLFDGDSFFVIGKGQHTINITYAPTNTSILQTVANSGKATMVIEAGSIPGTSTPGFEFILLVSGLMIAAVVLKKKKKQ